MAGDETPDLFVPSTVAAGGETAPATQQDMEYLFEHLEGELDDAGFFYPPDKRPVMVRNLRNIFMKADLTEPEARTLREAPAQ